MGRLKLRATWFVLLVAAYLILIINDIHYLLKFDLFLSQMKELLKENSKYIEDGDFYLIHENIWNKLIKRKKLWVK